MNICSNHKIAEGSVTWDDLYHKLAQVHRPHSNMTSPCPLCLLEMMTHAIKDETISSDAHDVVDAYYALKDAQEHYSELIKDTTNYEVANTFGKGALEYLELDDSKHTLKKIPIEDYHSEDENLPF